MTAVQLPAEPQTTDIKPTLRRCVGDPAVLDAAWGRAPLHLRRTLGESQAFVDVLTLAQLDEYVSMSARTPAVRMVIGGDVIPASRYCAPVRIGGKLLDDVVDARKVASLLADGATLVVQSLHRTIPSVAQFVAALQVELGHPVQANAYLTPPTAAGLSSHTDRHDVIALQLEGRKSWWVDGLGEIELHPGDGLYIPVGTRHRASTSTETSLHLTVGIIRVTRRQVLERMLGRASADLDEPLPIGYRDPARREELALALDDVLEQTLDAVGGTDLDDLVDVERHRRLEPPPQPGRLRSVTTADRIEAATLVRWVGAPPLLRRTADGADRIAVHLGDRILTLPAATAAALAALGSGGTERVGDLPGLDAPSRVVVARRLVREGACIVDRFGDPALG